jgi:hypothetical protein
MSAPVKFRKPITINDERLAARCARGRVKNVAV